MTEEIHAIFMRNLKQLRRLIVGMGLSVDDGEDVLQDVYVQAMKGPREYLGDGKTVQWLIRVTANRVLLEFRRRKRDRQVVSEVSRE